MIDITVPRLFGWLLIALLLAGLVWLVAPQQLPVSLYKLSLVTAGGVAGYWFDRSVFPYARPDKLLAWSTSDPHMANAFGLAMQRRALIVAAFALGMGLGA